MGDARPRQWGYILVFFKKISKEDEISQLGRFAGQNLAFASTVLSKDDQVIPFAACFNVGLIKGSMINKQTFVAEQYEDCIYHAQIWFDNPPFKNIKKVVMCFDGYITRNDVRTDALLLLAKTGTTDIAFQIALPYSKNESGEYYFEKPFIMFSEEKSRLEPFSNDIELAVYAGRADSGIPRDEIPKWGKSF